MKTAARRYFHEQKAARMRTDQAQPNPPTEWDRYAPLIDHEMSRMSAGDRDCVAMRFLRGLSLGEIAMTR